MREEEFSLKNGLTGGPGRLAAGKDFAFLAGGRVGPAFWNYGEERGEDF